MTSTLTEVSFSIFLIGNLSVSVFTCGEINKYVHLFKTDSSVSRFVSNQPVNQDISVIISTAKCSKERMNSLGRGSQYKVFQRNLFLILESI